MPESMKFATASPILRLMALLALLFFGAIFGFFFAWVCSTMWGLDAANPVVAVAAMQAMNEAVRNAVFFPAFFLTPVVGALTAYVAWRGGYRTACGAFLAASLVYAVGAFLPTATVNVPMNEALAAQGPVESVERAAEIWAAYSPDWQWWNTARTLASGVALLLVGWAMLNLSTHQQAQSN